MYLKIANGSKDKLDFFKSVVGTASAISGQVSLYPSPDGLFIQCLDVGKCCLFETTLPAGWFDEYKETENLQLPLFAKLVTKVLGTVGSDEELTIESSGGDKLKIKCSGQNDMKRVFELPLFEAEDDRLEIPEWEEADVDVSVSYKLLGGMIDQVIMFAPRVTWKIFQDEDEVTLAGSSESGNVALDLDISEGEGSPLIQTFSAAWFKVMCGLGKVTGTQAKLQFRDERPVLMSVDAGEGATARFCLSPYVDE